MMKNAREFLLNVFPLVSVCLLIAWAMPVAQAQASEQEPSFWTQPRLTGEWGGLRSQLKEKGLTLDLEHTSIYQGLWSGEDEKDFEYGGRIDAFFNINTTKLGLWEGGGIKTHFEFRHGEGTPYRGGGLLAVNTGMYFPTGDSEKLVATSLYLTQNFSNTLILMLGKINAPDLLGASNFFGGWGIHRFINLAFVAPPSGIPPAIRIGGVATLKTTPLDWTLFIYDPKDRTDDYFPDDLFSEGVISNLSAKRTTTWAGRATSFTLGGIYSTKEGVDLSEVPFPPGLETTNKQGSYNVSFTFTHNLQESQEDPRANWGLNLKVNIADGNPNPIQQSVMGGVAGKALFLNRPQDSFGLGAYYFRFSQELRSSLDSAVDFDHEHGLEAFYSWAVTPWMHLTGDLQYIDPGKGGRENATVAGLRLNLRF